MSTDPAPVTSEPVQVEPVGTQYFDRYGCFTKPAPSERTKRVYKIDRELWARHEAERVKPTMRAVGSILGPEICCVCPWVASIMNGIMSISPVLCSFVSSVYRPEEAPPPPAWSEQALVLTDTGVRGFSHTGEPQAITWDGFAMEDVQILGAPRSGCCHSGEPTAEHEDLACSVGVGCLGPCAHVMCINRADPRYFRVVIQSMEKHSLRRAPDGDDASSAAFSEGQVIEARFRGIQEHWYAAKVVKVNADGTVDVAYDDGGKEAGVVPSNIRAGGDGINAGVTIVAWALAAEPDSLLAELQAGCEGATPRAPPYIDAQGQGHLPSSSERTTRRLGLDPALWARYQHEREKPMARALASCGREQWNKDDDCSCAEHCCVLPWTGAVVACAPLFAASFLRRLCTRTEEQPLPPWHAEALVFTDAGVKGHDREGKPTAIRWDAVDVEAGVEIRRPQPTHGCCHCTEQNCRGINHDFLNDPDDVACGMGVGLFYPCARVACRQASLPGFYHLIIRSKDGSTVIDVKGLSEGSEDTVRSLLADGTAAYQAPAVAAKPEGETDDASKCKSKSKVVPAGDAPAGLPALAHFEMVPRAATDAPAREFIDRGQAAVMVQPERQQRNGACTVM
jgi:hypothetical protein